MKQLFSGVYTAILTPFKEGAIDFTAYKDLIEMNIAAGVSGIVPAGTTGESPTLTHEEQLELIKVTVEQVNGRVKVIAGTGSNCTATAIELTKRAAALGIDGALVVNPYYNKPTQEGLFRHFKAIADNVNIPIVLYNIKGRTGVNVETATLLRIIKHCPNVCAVKEASGDMQQIQEVINSVPEHVSVLSGDDGITLEVIKAGGKGVISVASNVFPEQMVQLVDAALDKKYEAAEALHAQMAPFFEVEFIETNPIPIKYVASQLNLCNEEYRLPLCELSAENKAAVDKVLAQMHANKNNQSEV